MATKKKEDQVGTDQHPLVGLVNDAIKGRDPSKWADGRPSDSSVPLITLTLDELKIAGDLHAKNEGDKRHGANEQKLGKMKSDMAWGNLALVEVPTLQGKITDLEQRIADALDKTEGGAQLKVMLAQLKDREGKLNKLANEVNWRQLQVSQQEEEHKALLDAASLVKMEQAVTAVATKLGIPQPILMQAAPFKDETELTTKATAIKKELDAMAGKPGVTPAVRPSSPFTPGAPAFKKSADEKVAAGLSEILGKAGTMPTLAEV